MKRINQIFFATCTWIILSTGLTAHAEVDKVVLARQFGIGYLQLAVMDQMKLVEKHLASVGLANTKVEWARFASGSAANDAMLSGRLHFAAGGTGPAFILWDKTRNNAKVHGVAALSSMPNLLVTRDPKIKTISDFSSNNKIAMAGAGSSVQTTYLQMAAAKTWGIAQYKKLDTLMVNLPHPEGLKTMLSGGTEVTSTFTTPPFQYMALENKDVRVVLNSYQIMGGRNTFLMVWATDAFRKDNPKSYRAVFNALKEATDWINANKQDAAQLYVKDTGGKETAESILKMLNDPDIQITLTPEKVLPYAQFMQEVGTLKNRPEKWTDLFFPELHSLPGS
jgi:NitT/TauT family transport system substrate-binding protein